MEYIDCPHENAFIVFVGETDEFLAAWLNERGKEHVERFYLWPREEMLDCIRQRETDVLQ